MRLYKVIGLAMLMSGCSWASTITVLNFSFETPIISQLPGISGLYEYRPTGASWTFNGSAGIAADGSAFDLVSAPDGTQAAFIQRNTGDMNQTLTGLVIGQAYFVTFQAAQRPDPSIFTSEEISSGTGFGGGQDFEVFWDGNSIGTFFPGSTSFSSYFTASFIATSTSGVLAFQGLDTLKGDRTAFIDAVQVNAVPEPWSAATVLSGIGLIGLGLRRKRAPHN